MWRIYLREHPAFGPWVQRVERRPAWAIKAAIAAAVLMFVVPLALLAVAAVAVGLAVLTILGAAATLQGILRSAVHGLIGCGWRGREPVGEPGAVWEDAEGRRNVRVIPPRD